MVSEIKCREVWGQISNYIEGDVRPEIRVLLERHLERCPRCAAVLDGTRNIVRLAGDERFAAVPKGFGSRLLTRLTAEIKVSEAGAQREIPLGITEDRVPLGSHLIYFWQTQAEFERGVRFLELGLSGDEHCVLFGHEEANHEVLETLRRRGYDVDRARDEERLVILRRAFGAQETLTNIEQAFIAAMRAGAKTIRYLGNLGMGQSPLPGRGTDDVLELESGATILGEQYPCVIVCMYDVKTVSGQLVMNGGFYSHPLAVCGLSLQKNPYYSGETLPRSRHVH